MVEAKFLSRPGKFNETEFVKFWYNCHTIFNSYDLSKSYKPFLKWVCCISRESNCIFLSKQWSCYGARIQNESERIIGNQKRGQNPGNYSNKKTNTWYHINGQKFFNAQISIAPIGIFLHWSGEKISGYFKTSEPLYSKLYMLNLKKTMFRTVDRDGDREISFIEFFTKLPELMTFISK